VDALGDIATTVKLVPHLQRFILSVDTVLWSTPRAIDEFFKLPEGDDLGILEHARPVHKLSESLSVLRRWRQVMEKEVKHLRSFRQSVANALRIPASAKIPITDMEGNELDLVQLKKCIQEVRRLVSAQLELELMDDTRERTKAKVG
jgi:hypothetical protein